MSAPQQFPAFLSIEYDGRGDGFPAFERAAGAAFNRVEGRMRQFTANFEEVGRVAAKAIAGGLSGAGGLDLNVGQFRQAAAEARLYESVMRELQQSTTALAAKTGDTSQATRSYIQAIGAQVVEARQASAQAEAQVTSYTRLQAALDSVADKNSRLAASYREVFAEQAKAAQAEVSQRQIQSAYNSTFAPGLTRSASTNGAGFGALEEMLKRRDALVTELNANVAELENRFEREASASAAAAERARAALAAQNEELRRQAQLLAEQAREQANVKANNDRFTLGPRAIDNGAGFGALAAELDRMEQAEREAAAAAKLYEQALFEIRQQVDPAYFAQKRFNEELARADQALKAGDITTDQYAKRIAFLRGEMALNATSTRQMRFASVQLGQQLQDVVIQAQMGTNAFVILAQQGSQMAFALTEAGGKVGALARIMAGWQGAIVFAGIALAGQLIPALIGTGKESDNAKQSTIDFSNSIVASTGLVGNYTRAIEQLSQATRGLINTQALLVDNTHAFAQNAVSQLQSQLAQLDGQIAKLNAASPITDFLFNANQNALQLAKLQKERAAIAANLRDAQKALAQTQTAIEARQANEAADPKGAQFAQIERDRARLLERRQYTLEQGPVPLQDANQSMLISEADFRREMEGLKRREEALRKNEQAGNAAAAAVRLAERGEDAAKKIANITDRFSDIPPQVRAVNAAMRELDDLANDFALKKPPNYAEIVEMLKQARSVIEEGINKPFEELLLTQSRELLVLDLQRDGYADQAAALRQIFQIEAARGKLSDDQKQAIYDNVVAIRLMNRELDIQRQKQQAYLTAVSDVQTAIRDTIAGIRTQGFDSLKGLVSGLRNTFDNLFANVVTEKLFGDLFRDINDQITGAGRVKVAQDIETAALLKAASKVEAFGNAVAKAANQVAEANGASGPVAANDNSAATAANDIIVTASRYPKDPGDFLGTVMTRLFQKFLGADSPLAKDIGKLLGDSIEGAAYGQMAGGLVLGSSGSKTGAAIGGALGNIAGKALGKAVGGTFGKALGPLGSIAGGILGSALGGLFKKAKYGTAVIGANAGGNLSIIGSGGNSGAAIKASTKAGNAIVENIDSIAEQLGGTVDASRGSVSIGQYKGKWRVSTSGYTGKLKVKNGAVDFGKDGAEEAARFAMQDLIRDGVIVGLRNGTQQLLKNAADLEKGLAKALKFEGVFKDLKKIKDPVGAAIDDINTEFKSLIKIFKEAGATTEETAQLEELYNIKRKAAVEDAMKSLTGSLQDLYKNLTIGDSGYSLRTRLANAKADYNPLAARVAAGDTTAYDDFANAAQTLIDLQREYSGSAPEYFALLDQVTQLTKGELDRQQAQFSSASGAASPFDTTPIVDATQQQTNAVVGALAAVNDNVLKQSGYLQQIAAALQANGSTRGLFALRNF